MRVSAVRVGCVPVSMHAAPRRFVVSFPRSETGESSGSFPAVGRSVIARSS